MFGALLKKRSLPGLCAINSYTEGIAIARLIPHTDKPELELCDFYPSEASPSQQLKALVDKHQLDLYSCVSLLNRDDYQLLMMESPPVPKDEMKLALRWRIKDLIDTPVTEVTLDSFDVPAPRGAEDSKSVYAVVARNDALHSHCEILTNANINLKIIDIMEMAQRNIANLLPENGSGVALLSLQPTSGLITLSKAGELYLSRPINITLEQVAPAVPAMEETSEQNDNDLSNLEIDLGFDVDVDVDVDLDIEMGNTAAYDHVALELQRSLDYYESNFRQSPIRKLYLAPTLRELPGFSKYIKDNLNIHVELLDLNDLFESKSTIPLATQAHVFFAIGAALHRMADEPGN